MFSLQMSLLAAGITLGLLTLTGAWDENFKSTKCYQYGLDDINDRMPVNLGNLIAIIEKWEREHTYQNPDAIADALIKRYRVDGITYQSSGNVFPWSPNELQEVEKQNILTAILTPSETVPQNLYEPREECSLHFMISHSTDTYPHAGLNYVWENSRRRRSDNIFPQSSQRYSLPTGVDPADHPIENGVIWTPYGPVAVGTLLSGIMASDKTSSVTIRQLYGDTQTSDMPTEMQNKALNPLYVSTLSGDIGQSAVLAGLVGTTGNQIYLGPNGKFNNLTAAPKLFTLKSSYNGITSYLSRAEIFAGIDAMVISSFMRTSTTSKVLLSQILRMYYSEHGLPNYPDARACNRMTTYRKLDSTNIQEQALNFMYAYSDKFPELKRMITEYKNDFSQIESSLKAALNNVWKAFSEFIASYDYSDYDRCPVYSKTDVMCENQVDLLMVYGHDSGISDMDKQRQYISLLSQMLGVSVEGSRLGILDGKSAAWIVPMTNFSNVADAGSNFTTSSKSSYGSGSDMVAVLRELAIYYKSFYNELLSDGNNAEARSQVVLWNVPGSIQTDTQEYLDKLREFRLLYPDVYFLLVGKSKGAFNDMLLDPSKDFFTNNVIDMEVFAATLAKRICQIPSVFTYPACDSNNVNFTNYREPSHIYTGYVSPNFTTYVKIAPKYFQFSGELKLMVSNADIQVCSSRTSMNVESTADDYYCQGGGSEFVWEELCGRWLEECDPIYLSVTGKSSTGTGGYCQDEGCRYPNQIVYEIHHEGMTCGAWWATPPILLLTIVSLIHFVHT